MKATEWIGWAASIILLLTIGRQVYTQWKTKSAAGVSHWLFIGQFSASVGFTWYSWLLKNWVFVSSNAALLVTAVLGQFIYLQNRRAQRLSAGKSDTKTATDSTPDTVRS
jgi:MtN3 and saliva related transmembrane protein